MKVLLLGATGLLGHNVLQHLMSDGHEVRVLVRNRASLRLPLPERCIVEGRLTDPAAVLQAADGCDAIVNCAGTTDMSLRRLADYLPVNSHLCQTLVQAMEQHSIKRLVHVSTVNTIGHGSAAQPSTEEAPMRPPFSQSLYAQSKQRGESVLLRAAQQHADWHVVVLNAGYMIGPWDVKPSSGRMLLMAYRHRIAFAPSGGKAFVDVRDVATAVVNALTQGQHGQRYLATNPAAEMTVRELYALQASTMGYEQRVVVLPRWIMCLGGWIGDALRAVGIRTALSTNNVRQLMAHEHYNPTLAQRELHMPSTPLHTSIADFHAWREQYISKK